MGRVTSEGAGAGGVHTAATVWGTIVVILFLAHGFATFYGYDRLPRVSSSDEVLPHDSALSWARGTGLRSPAHDGTWLGRLYAHYPPVFTVLQAATFRVTDISAFSMRGWGMVSHVLAVLALLSICHALYRRRTMDEAATTMVALLIVTEPISMSLARWGRVDPVAIFLGIGAAWVLIAIGRERPARWQWTISAVLIGLSISSHPFGVVYFIAFLTALFLRWRWVGVRAALWSIAIPGLTFGLLWILVIRSGLSRHSIRCAQSRRFKSAPDSTGGNTSTRSGNWTAGALCKKADR